MPRHDELDDAGGVARETARDDAASGDGVRGGPGRRRLAVPPSNRYREPGDREPSVRASRPDEAHLDRRGGPGRVGPGSGGPGLVGPGLVGPLARASLAAVAGAALLVFVGAILASTAGLLFVAGVTGAAVGLILSRAAVPLDDGIAPASRRRVAWLAVTVSLAAVVVAALVTWVVARQEGGTLGPIDYLLETFGPFIPAEAIVGAVAAWWGAVSGPVQR